jgi:hypothetical protein
LRLRRQLLHYGCDVPVRVDSFTTGIYGGQPVTVNDFQVEIRMLPLMILVVFKVTSDHGYGRRLGSGSAGVRVCSRQSVTVVNHGMEVSTILIGWSFPPWAIRHL